MFQPLVRQGGYQQQQGALAGIYHLAVGVQGPYFTTSSLCRKSSVELEQSYWFNVTYNELVRYQKAFNNKVICKKCMETLL
jgi:hypothetical protein